MTFPMSDRTDRARGCEQTRPRRERTRQNALDGKQHGHSAARVAPRGVARAVFDPAQRAFDHAGMINTATLNALADFPRQLEAHYVAIPARFKHWTPQTWDTVPSEPFTEFPHTAPMIIDMSNGFHFRPESRGFLLAWNDPEETPGFKTEFDAAFVEKILSRAADRVPCFANLPVNPKRAWAGLYEMTPDHHPILGEVPAVPGFFLANGFSGHGVMHAPATGKILSDLILTGQTDLIDASLLNLARFAEGRMIHETAVL